MKRIIAEERAELIELTKDFDKFLIHALQTSQLENYNTTLDDYGKRMVRAIQMKFRAKFSKFLKDESADGKDLRPEHAVGTEHTETDDIKSKPASAAERIRDEITRGG